MKVILKTAMSATSCSGSVLPMWGAMPKPIWQPPQLDPPNLADTVAGQALVTRPTKAAPIAVAGA
eukprot:5917393-Pyramimonas_sp.AAC.1